jgi:hypothetical protein
MKRLIILAVILIVLTALSSCYWMGDFSTGGISMDFSEFQPRAAGDVVRVYLIANGLLFSTDSNVPFMAEVPLATGVADTIIEIDGLPVGPTYKAMIGVGPVTNDIFQPRAYGETPEFQISSGEGTSVNPTMEYLSYFWGSAFPADLQGRPLTGVTAGSFNMYTAESSKIYLIDSAGNILESYDLPVDPAGFGVSSLEINSLSRDDSGGWFQDAFINSNQGIVPFENVEGWIFDTTFSSGLAGDREIEESGAFDLGNDRAVFFRRQSGIGGKNFGSAGGNYWINLDTDDVTDMVHSNLNAYFATEGGAFALPWDFLTDPTPKFSEKRMDFSGPAKILSLGYVPPTVAAAQIYMGTTNGVWYGDLSESPVTIGTLTQIPETAGDAIDMIDLSSDSPSSYQAYLSRYYLYIRKYGSVYKFPFFAILPGKVSGLSWDPNFNYTLYIAGSDGLSVLYVGS